MVCPNCGGLNAATARFCVFCGTPLAARASGGGEERKVVTVLFAELVGFEEQADQADPEDVKATLLPFHARLKQVIEHFGGTVDKFIGDVVMGVFGAPAAHEDDPIRAVLTALRIQETVAEVNDQIPGPALLVRIGVNTGEAMVALGGSGPQIGESVTGDAVNVASRLQGVAAGGEIVVGEETYRATAPFFSYQERPPVHVKGKAETLRIWRPVSARARVGVDLRRPSPTPFVGRADELQLLEGAFRRALRERSVQLVTVTGEPGVGKTRIVEELSARLEELPELIRWRQGRCLPYGEGVSYWALGEIVKAEAGILEADPPAMVGAKLARALEPIVSDQDEREWLRARLSPLAGVGETSSTIPREELFRAWQRFLEALATHTPIVLVFEDLHWADPPMLEFLDQLVDRTARVPMLVICAARPELYERHPAWGGGKRNSTTLAVPPLSEPETAMLISALLDRAVLPADTQADLLERAGGNPLFAEEFIRMLVDRELLSPRGGSSLPEGLEIDVPRTVQAIIAARLDTLPLDRKALLHDAAVVGRMFWVGALSAMSGQEPHAVQEGLHEIVRKELVRPIRVSSLKDQVEYAFWHGLVADVAYGQLPRAARAVKHRAVAEWLERVGQGRLSDLAELLAHHATRALDLARATGLEDDQELAAAAARALVLAGERASRLDAVRAESSYRRALELLPEGREGRAEALFGAASMASVLGRIADAERDFELALSGFLATGDRVGMGDAMVVFSRFLARRGETARSRALAEEAVTVLEAEPPGMALARAYTNMASQSHLASDFQHGQEWADKALALGAELGHDDELVVALQYRGASRSELGDPGGLDDMREALRVGLDRGVGEGVSIAYNNLADQLWLREGPHAALPVWRDMAEFARVRGFATEELWAKAGIIQSLFDTGEWDEALQIAGGIRSWDAEHGATKVATFARIFQAWTRFRRGEMGEAEALAAELLPEARAIQHAEFLAPALVIAAEVRVAGGDAAGARDLIDEFLAATEEQADQRQIYLPIVCRILAASGAADLAAELVPEERLEMSTRYRHSVVTARAIVAEGQGRFEDALAEYEEAAARWAEYGFLLEVGQCRLGRGRCLLALGRTADGEQALEQARATLGPLRTRPLLEQIDLLLERPAAVGS